MTKLQLTAAGSRSPESARSDVGTLTVKRRAFPSGAASASLSVSPATQRALPATGGVTWIAPAALASPSGPSRTIA